MREIGVEISVMLQPVRSTLNGFEASIRALRMAQEGHELIEQVKATTTTGTSPGRRVTS